MNSLIFVKHLLGGVIEIENIVIYHLHWLEISVCTCVCMIFLDIETKYVKRLFFQPSLHALMLIQKIFRELSVSYTEGIKILRQWGADRTIG